MARIAQAIAAKFLPGFVPGRDRVERPAAPVRRLTPSERTSDVRVINAEIAAVFAAHYGKVTR